jgi:hypothetical protein
VVPYQGDRHLAGFRRTRGAGWPGLLLQRRGPGETANQRLEQYLRKALPGKEPGADPGHARREHRALDRESVASGEMVLVQVDASGKPISHKVYARPD